jgi:outer membrane lipoprotein-sorting protein
MTRAFVVRCLAGALLASAVTMAMAQTSEAPAELLDKIRAALASEQGVSAADVKVVSAESVNWPNGALGCPKPGRMYTQAIVPGYRILLEAAGKRFAYNASTRGGYKRCDNALGGTFKPRSAK